MPILRDIIYINTCINIVIYIKYIYIYTYSIYKRVCELLVT